MLRGKLLNELLGNFLSEAKELQAALIVDLDGLIIAQKSIQGFAEEIIGAIMSVLEGTISKIKRFVETTFGSGTFDVNEFRLFYMELGGQIPALFVLVAGPYSNFTKYISYSYIVAEKISQIFNDREIDPSLPSMNEKGELIFESIKKSGNSKNIENKIVIIGTDKVGKTTLVNMYVNGEFNDNYKPTLGISIVKKELQITKNTKISFFLFDMGGLKSFAKVRKNFYDNTKVVIILFDFSKMDTLERITEWIEEARYFIKNTTVPYIIVGNKVDLVKNRDELRNKALDLVSHYNFPFFETSSFTGEGIDELFVHITSNLLTLQVIY